MRYEEERFELFRGLAMLNYMVNLYNKAGLTNINHYAEDFFLPIFNQFYSTTFRNINLEKSNKETIDLISIDGSIVIQVTSNDKPEKLKSFLTNVQISNPNSQAIYFLISLSNPVSKTLKDVCSNINHKFKFEEHYITLDSLSRKVLALSEKKSELISMINSFYLKEFESVNVEMKNNGCIYLDELYWETRHNIPHDNYYSNLNSNSEVITSAILNNKAVNLSFRLRNYDGKYNIQDILRKYISQSNYNLLLKILGPSGSGKSTMMFRIAYDFSDSFEIIYINSEKYLNSKIKFENTRPCMFLFDGIDVLSKVYNTVLDQIRDLKSGSVVVIAEQTINWELWETRKYFEKGFHEVKEGEVRLSFKDIVSLFRIISETTNYKPYLKHNWVISDYIIDYFINEGHRISHFKPDWIIWNELTMTKENNLKNLYLYVAFFNFYGIQCNITKICSLFNVKYNHSDLLEIANEVYPIRIVGPNITLRHEKLSKWFFQTNRSKLSILIEEVKKGISDPGIHNMTIYRKLLDNQQFVMDSNLSIQDIILNYKKFQIVTEKIKDEYIKNTCSLAKTYFFNLKDKHKALEEIVALKNTLNDNKIIPLEYNFKLLDAEWWLYETDFEDTYKLHKQDIYYEKIYNQYLIKKFIRKNYPLELLNDLHDKGDLTTQTWLDYIFSKERYNIPKESKFMELKYLYSKMKGKDGFFDILQEKFQKNSDARSMIALTVHFEDLKETPFLTGLVFRRLCDLSEIAILISSFKDLRNSIDYLQMIFYFLSSLNSERATILDDNQIEILCKEIHFILENKKPSNTQIALLYKNLIKLYYRSVTFDKIEEITNILKTAITKYLEVPYLKILLAKHYARYYSDEEQLILAKRYLEDIPNDLKKTPEYIFAEADLLYSTGNFAEAEKKLDTVSIDPRYTRTSIFIRLNKYLLNYENDKVLYLIEREYLNKEKYSDSDIVEIYFKSFLKFVKNDKHFLSEFEKREKLFKNLIDFGCIQFRLIIYVYNVTKRSFNEDKESFEELQRQVYSDISQENIRYFLDSLTYFAKTGHFEVMYRMIQLLKQNGSLVKYIQKNKYINFLNYFGKLVRLDEIYLFNNFTSKRHYLAAPRELKGEFQINMINYYKEALIRSGKYRKAIIYLAILLKASVNKQVTNYLQDQLRFYIRQFKQSGNDVVVYLSSNENKEIVFDFLSTKYKVSFKFLEQKVNAGWVSKKKAYVHIDSLGKARFPEVYFVINGRKEEKESLNFTKWLQLYESANDFLA